MGFFRRSDEESALAMALMTIARAYLRGVEGSSYEFEPMVAATRERIESLARAVKTNGGTKGLARVKRETMSYVWSGITADPATSFREGSPARRAHDQFEALLDELVPS